MLNEKKDINIIIPVISTEKWINNKMISRKINGKNFIEGISKYAKCIEIPIEKLLEGKDNLPDFDYIWVDFTDLKALLFIFREQGKISKPFLIKLPVVFGELILLTKIIPLLKKEDIIFGPSQFARNCFMKISNKFDVKVFSNTIDVKRIQKTIRHKSKNKKVLTFLGRIVPDKGLSELIECLHDIIDFDNNVELRIIGPFSGDIDDINLKSDYYLKLVKLINDLNLNDYVVWCGPLYGDAKYQALAESDILINPSVFKGETFGVINIEALACGVPVICSNWSGFGEIIKHGYNGYLIKVNEDPNNNFDYTIDKKELTEYITKLLGDDELLSQMKINSEKSALDFDHDKIHSELFNSLTPGKTITGNWDQIKNKKISDFKDLYVETYFKLVSVYHLDEMMIKNIIDNVTIENNNSLQETFLDLLNSFKIDDKKMFGNFHEEHLYNLIYLNQYLKEDSFLNRITDKDKKYFFEFITK